MCRLLCVRSPTPFALRDHLDPFARVARDSREYQGHGWGCAWFEDGVWRTHHAIEPVWEDDRAPFDGCRSTVLLAHARSAFRDEGIRVENNMPFTDGQWMFAFNGELRGVRIREEGRIGAEKVFNVVRRMDSGDTLDAMRRAVRLIESRTRYVRAMNFLMVDPDRALLATVFGEDPEYFQMHRRQRDGTDVVCSDPYAGEKDWTAIPNRTITAL